MTTMPQRESTIAVPDDRRKQLGAFLRARRESLDPQRRVALVGRRRTPGLRREEVAMLADVGVTVHRLEQGREVNPSEAVLVGVANALQCSPLETRHLFVLAGLTPPEATQVTVCEGISPGTRRMLDSLMPQPASIQKPNFDIVAWNDSFCRLMGIDFATLPEEDRNCIYLYLTHETWRSRIENRDVLPTFVSYFRAAMAEHRGDPAWENKLARFSPPRRSLKRCGISATRCAAWKTRLNILTTRSSGDSACSRCTGIRRRATARACWSTCRWTRRASRRWRGWTNINHRESDGWQCAIFGYCPAGAAGRFPFPPGVGEGKHCREVLYVIYDFSTHCAPDTPSALCHSWRRERTGGTSRRRPLYPRAPASNIAAARCLRLIPAGFGSGRGSVHAKHGPQPASMRAAPACRERLSDVEAATPAVSVAQVGKLTAG